MDSSMELLYAEERFLSSDPRHTSGLSTDHWTPGLEERVLHAWREVFFSSKYVDQVLDREFQSQKKWGARDRRAFAEVLFDGVRWRRKIWWAAGLEESAELPDLRKFLGCLRDGAWRTKKAPTPAIHESIPDWLEEFGANDRQAAWEGIRNSFNLRSPVDLRVNSLKVPREEALVALSREQIDADTIPGLPWGISLRERQNVFRSKAFELGLFEVQDRGSQRIAPLCQVEPGMRIIDACAGAGGKSLHLAALMKNRGKIVSLDVNSKKLQELRERSSRAGVDIVETRLIDSSKVIKRLEGSADRVLLDVPCSGLGVLRRNPDTKWKLHLEEIHRLMALQTEILESYSAMVKPGGLLIYATCSILKCENDFQIEQFLGKYGTSTKNSNPTASRKSSLRFEVVEQVRIDPDQGQGDGFFACVLKRSS